MLTNLPQDFIDAIESKSRKPVQLIEFFLPNETFYLSDKAIGKGQGLSEDYQPWVESWGTLKDNTNLTNLFEGNSLEIRSGTITILVSPVSRTFVKKLFQVGVENTRVKLYQWFSGIASEPLLIDTMVCQDPIRHSESTMLLSIDLVSTLMKTDPHLWPEEPGVEAQPIVIGKATGMPLKDLQTARVTEIADDIAFDYTGSLFIGNGVGFAASGVVSIDSEDMAYTSISASAIVISSRAQNGTTARPHLRGALMSPYGATYDYAICSGPVQLVDNLLGNGEPYVNDVELFPGQNPVIARFIGRPPWLKVSPGQDGDDIIPDPVTNLEYGNATEQHYGNGAAKPTTDSDNSINSPSGSTTMAISQQTGGGPGTLVNRQSTVTDSYNLWGTTPSYSYNPSMLIGTESWASPRLRTNTHDVYPITSDNVEGHVDHIYGHDDSAYGELLSVTVKVTFNTCEITRGDGKIEVFFVSAGGGETILDSDTVLEYDGDVFGANFKFNDSQITYTIKQEGVSGLVNNFADLALCRIRVRYTNIRINLETATYTDYGRCEWSVTNWNISYNTPAGNIPSPYQELASKFNRDLSSLGAINNVTAKVYFSAVIGNANVNFKIIRRQTDNPVNDSTLWSTTTSNNISGSERTFVLGSMSWADFQNLRIGIHHQITGPETENIVRSSNISFSYVKYELTYQPGAIETPDEERVVYAETIVCDVTSNIGANPTPPQVARQLIEDHSGAGAYVDDSDFNSAHTEYDSASYYLNGVLPPGIKLHAALKQVLMEGMCRLLFNQGSIKLISYFESEDLAVDFEVSTDDIQLRSRKTDNQPTSIIKNDITVMYDRDYDLEVYDGKIHVEDSESIALFFRKDYRRELKLVDSESVAQLHADRLLAIQSTPTSVYSFQMFMKAYQLEKGDRISVRTFLDPRFISTGNILSIERLFGKGKAQQINLFKLSIANPVSTVFLDLEDNIVVDDNSLLMLKGLVLKDTILLDDSDITYKKVFNFPNERLQIKEDLYFDTCEKDGYGTCGYGAFGYGE